MRFIDYTKIYVKAGKGGDGIVAFRREKYVPRGGPAGGDGGKGGDIIIEADPNLMTLQDFSYQKHYKAEDGERGKGDNRKGKDGESLVIKVPVGTIIRNAQTKEVIADLTKPYQRVVVAKGGRGGYGNTHFKNAQNQTPYVYTKGEEGEELWIELELKILADIGLVGYPNAGKSTFLSVVSNAKPKIADYPFTTLTPNIGIVKVEEFKSIVIADIPGLIEGASDGKGLGIEFLKHIERTKALMFIISSESFDSQEIRREFDSLREELKKFDESLLKKDFIITISKVDLIPDDIKEEFYEEVIEEFKDITDNIYFFSSMTKEGINQLLYALKKIVFEQ